jgi:hypothetical protein
LVHRFNLLLEPTRRTRRAELAGGIYQDWQGVAVSGGNPANASDKCSRLESADANRISVGGVLSLPEVLLLSAFCKKIASLSRLNRHAPVQHVFTSIAQSHARMNGADAETPSVLSALQHRSQCDR